MDTLINKMVDDGLSPDEQLKIKEKLQQEKKKIYRESRLKYTPSDFEHIAIIGRGAFGEVRLCRWKKTGNIVAMKKLKKTEMIKKNQEKHIRAERDFLAKSNNPWIVTLKCAFHDENFLYLVMEYLPGGDLMNLLMKREILTEEEGRFYMAESILAVESVHRLNYIHRDLKPDNILIDAQGHCKLSDFGLCKFVVGRVDSRTSSRVVWLAEHAPTLISPPWEAVGPNQPRQQTTVRRIEQETGCSVWSELLTISLRRSSLAKATQTLWTGGRWAQSSTRC